jgi:hypothetical protein
MSIENLFFPNEYNIQANSILSETSMSLPNYQKIAFTYQTTNATASTAYTYLASQSGGYLVTVELTASSPNYANFGGLIYSKTMNYNGTNVITGGELIIYDNVSAQSTYRTNFISTSAGFNGINVDILPGGPANAINVVVTGLSATVINWSGVVTIVN